MVALVRHEDLRLVGEAAERRRMDDPVAVALEIGAGRRKGFGLKATAGGARIDRVGRAIDVLIGPAGLERRHEPDLATPDVV